MNTDGGAYSLPTIYDDMTCNHCHVTTTSTSLIKFDMALVNETSQLGIFFTVKMVQYDLSGE